MLWTCAELMPQMLEAAGFRNTRSEHLHIELAGSSADTVVARQNIVGACRSFKRVIVQQGGSGILGSAEEYDALLDDLDSELEVGVNGSYPWKLVAVVAQKA